MGSSVLLTLASKTPKHAAAPGPSILMLSGKFRHIAPEFPGTEEWDAYTWGTPETLLQECDRRGLLSKLRFCLGRLSLDLAPGDP